MIDPTAPRKSVAEIERERARYLENLLAKAEERAKYWEAAYFDHMRDEHPEVVERAMRRIAERAS